MDTNRALYLAILRLIEQQKDNTRDLEDYLRALRSLVSKYKGQAALPTATFIHLLEQAFSSPVDPFAELGPGRDVQRLPADPYQKWDATIIEQIIDLQEMKKVDGLLEKAFFGVQSPRGNYWFNTSVTAYLECATEGSFGGWQPGDAGERELVPGDVAYLKPDGTIGSAPSGAFEHPIQELCKIDWDLATEFLRAGQYYE
jgi:hypothetical protein